MAKKEDLTGWVIEAITAYNGEATIVQICKYVWDHHEIELRESGDLFYTWGYDIRWAAQWLRDNDYLLPIEACKRGVWAATAKGLEAATVGIP